MEENEDEVFFEISLPIFRLSCSRLKVYDYRHLEIRVASVTSPFLFLHRLNIFCFMQTLKDMQGHPAEEEEEECTGELLADPDHSCRAEELEAGREGVLTKPLKLRSGEILKPTVLQSSSSWLIYPEQLFFM